MIVIKQMSEINNSNQFLSPNHQNAIPFAQRKLRELIDQGRKLDFKSIAYSQMPEIQISVHGNEKLLKSLKPHKAAGPHQSKPIILRVGGWGLQRYLLLILFTAPSYRHCNEYSFEAVHMSIHNQCLEHKKEKVAIFMIMKNAIFRSMNEGYILHRYVNGYPSTTKPAGKC